MRQLRSGLQPTQEPFTFTRMPVLLTPIDLNADCSSLRGDARRACQRRERGR